MFTILCIRRGYLSAWLGGHMVFAYEENKSFDYFKAFFLHYNIVEDLLANSFTVQP